MLRFAVILLVVVGGCGKPSVTECLQGVRSDACKEGAAECRIEFNNCTDQAYRAINCEPDDTGQIACACQGYVTGEKKLETMELSPATFDEAIELVNKQCSEFRYTGKKREWAWD